MLYNLELRVFLRKFLIETLFASTIIILEKSKVCTYKNDITSKTNHDFRSNIFKVNILQHD